VTVKETTPWMVADFESMFAGQGVKIQPTPSNKPTSQITILEFGTFADIEKLPQALLRPATRRRTGGSAAFPRVTTMGTRRLNSRNYKYTSTRAR
jgi:hypothetical protein